MTDGRHAALLTAAAERSLNAAERARRTLVDLHKRGETITFAAVATRASVSRQFLYAHADLRGEIERLRTEPPPAPVRLPVRERASEASIRTRLRAALDENKRLRDEVAELRDELALAHGRVRELELTARTVKQTEAARPTPLPPS